MGYKYKNSSYHRYFEDYTERIVPKTNGSGTKVELYYIGEYYSQKGKTWQIAARKSGYLLLFLMAAVLFVRCGVKDWAGGQSWYLIITEAAVLLSLNWLLYALFCYIISKRKMTIGAYKSGSRSVIYASKVSVACLAATLVAQIVCLFSSGREQVLLQIDGVKGFYLSQILNLAGYLLAGILIGLIGCLESKSIYIKMPNTDIK